MDSVDRLELNECGQLLSMATDMIPSVLKRTFVVVFWAVTLLVGAAFVPAFAQQTDLTKADALDVRRDAVVEAIERVMPSVVNVEGSADVDPNSVDDRLMAEFFGWRLQQVQEAVVSRGSGVVIDEEGYVLTNVHVVDGVKRVFVKFNDGSDPIEAERVALNAAKDVALLRLKSPGRKFPAVKFAKDDDLLLGETVIALGNPFGYAGSVSRGILSSRARRGPNEDRSRGELDTLDWIQTDAAINPGNSGGPLINLRGDLIGINVATLRPQMGAQGIGFAIPIKRVNQALAEVLSGESVGRFWFDDPHTPPRPSGGPFAVLHARVCSVESLLPQPRLAHHRPIPAPAWRRLQRSCQTARPAFGGLLPQRRLPGRARATIVVPRTNTDPAPTPPRPGVPELPEW